MRYAMTKVADYHNKLSTRDTPAEQCTKTPPIYNSTNKTAITLLYGFEAFLKVHTNVLCFRVLQWVGNSRDG